MLNNLFLILLFGLYLVNVFVVGDLFFRRGLKVKFASLTEKYCFQFAIGNFYLSLLFIYLGMVHLLYSAVLLVIYLLPPLAISFQLIKRRNTVWINSQRLVIFKKWFRNNYAFCLVVLFVIFPLVPFLFLYPGSWDALAYHLVLPKFYLRAHYFPMWVWFAESANPIGIEAIYGMGEVFADPRLGNLINFSFILATLTYLSYGLRYKFSKQILFVAGLLFLIRPIFYTEFAFNPNVDYPLTFFATLLVISFDKFREARDIRFFALASLFAGFSFLTKYTGLVLMLSLALTTLVYLSGQFWQRRWQGIRTSLGLNTQRWLALSLVLLVIVPGVFWLGRNYLYVGNPVYPYFRSFFPDYEQKLNIKEVTQSISDENQYWVASRQNLLQHNDNAQDFLMLFERYSVFFFLALLVVGLLQPINPSIRYYALFSLIFFLGIKFAVGPLFRYFFPVYPMICLIWSSVLFYFLKQRWQLAVLPLLILGLSIVMQIDATNYVRFNNFLQVPKLDWIESLNNNFARRQVERQDNWDAISYVNKNLDSGQDTALVMFDNRLYYYNVPVVYANTLIYFSDKNPIDVEQTLQFLKGQKIDYIVESDNWGVPRFINKSLYEQFIQTHTEKVFQGRSTEVYKII